MSEAEQLTEYIRHTIETLPIQHQKSRFQCTASLGISNRPAAKAIIPLLIKEADEALYQAKAQGLVCRCSRL